MKASIFSPATILTIAALAGGSDATNVWTVNCFPLTQYRADPIISPGVASGHVHSVIGGTGFNRTMSATTSTSSLNTTCDKYTDHSNYWVPSLYYAPGNGQLTLLPFRGAGMYYKNYTCDYNPSAPGGYCQGVSAARAFPPGFRMVVGNSTRRSYNSSAVDQTALSFTYGNNYYNYVGMPPNVVGGGNFQGNVQYPSCWDGVNTYLPNDAHVSYPDPMLGNSNIQGGMCPSSHPKALISIGAEFFWDATGVNTTNGSQLVFANGDTTGYGFHGDFFQGWQNSTALFNSFANCSGSSCPWDAFGTPNGQPYSQNYFNPQVAPVFEQPIGLNGPISYLPGDTTTSNCVYNCNIKQPFCC